MGKAHGSLQARLNELETLHDMQRTDNSALLDAKKAQREFEKRVHSMIGEIETLEKGKLDLRVDLKNLRAEYKCAEKKILALEAEVKYEKEEARREREKRRAAEFVPAEEHQQGDINQGVAGSIEDRMMTAELEMREKAAEVFARNKAFANMVPELAENRESSPLGKRKRERKREEKRERESRLMEEEEDAPYSLPPALSTINTGTGHATHKVEQNVNAKTGAGIEKGRGKGKGMKQDKVLVSKADFSRNEMEQEDQSDSSAFKAGDDRHESDTAESASEDERELARRQQVQAKKKKKDVKGGAKGARKSTAGVVGRVSKQMENTKVKKHKGTVVVDNSSDDDSGAGQEKEKPVLKKQKYAVSTITAVSAPSNAASPPNRKSGMKSGTISRHKEKKEAERKKDTVIAKSEETRKKIALNTRPKSAFSWNGSEVNMMWFLPVKEVPKFFALLWLFQASKSILAGLPDTLSPVKR